MKFLVVYRPSPKASSTAADREEMGKYSAKMSAAGLLLSQAMLGPTATTIQLDRGAYTQSESAEEFVGYAFISAASREEAIQHTREFLGVAGDGVTELRQVMEE